MPSFYESDLHFTFPEGWKVRKFDDTVAYRSLSGYGLKGVDFLCLTPEGEIWLMEVKNYRNRSERYQAVRKHPTALAEHVGRKFADSQRLVSLVDRAMRVNWWLRFKLWWFDLLGAEQPASLHWFWHEAARRLADPRKLVCVLWLETPEKHGHYERATLTRLKDLLKPDKRFFIAEMGRSEDLPLRVVPVIVQT